MSNIKTITIVGNGISPDELFINGRSVDEMSVEDILSFKEFAFKDIERLIKGELWDRKHTTDEELSEKIKESFAKDSSVVNAVKVYIKYRACSASSALPIVKDILGQTLNSNDQVFLIACFGILYAISNTSLQIGIFIAIDFICCLMAHHII